MRIRPKEPSVTWLVAKVLILLFSLALLVAVAASNSFALPTHQVNALFMAPGGYRGRDYLVAGGVMTVIFLVIAVGAIWLLFLGPVG